MADKQKQNLHKKAMDSEINVDRSNIVINDPLEGFLLVWWNYVYGTHISEKKPNPEKEKRILPKKKETMWKKIGPGASSRRELFYQTTLEKLQENYYKERRRRNVMNIGLEDEEEVFDDKEVILIERFANAPAEQNPQEHDPPAGDGVHWLQLIARD